MKYDYIKWLITLTSNCIKRLSLYFVFDKILTIFGKYFRAIQTQCFRFRGIFLSICTIALFSTWEIVQTANDKEHNEGNLYLKSK